MLNFQLNSCLGVAGTQWGIAHPHIRLFLLALVSVCLGCTTIDESEVCVATPAVVVDWGVAGASAVGWMEVQSTSNAGGSELNRPFVVYYPGASSGEEVEPSSGGPYPVVFFEHAGGAHYLDYSTLFHHLASHGFVVVSIDHNALDGSTGWGSEAFWDGHVTLFVDTLDEVFEWNTMQGHRFHGVMDFDRLGLAGHSHGAVLRTMHTLGPTDPASPYQVRAISLLAPCPDLPMEDYVEGYPTMPPLQVIYGSRDQDGCVAYGQSIAVFEVGGLPKHFVHVPGANHYGFTDSGSLGDATISRESHQEVAKAGLLAWFSYLLNGDPEALPTLRGEQDLVSDEQDLRIQFLDRVSLRVDGFTPDEGTDQTETIQIPAITGIEGQTFINGFLSDAFADPEKGTALVRAQVEALLDTEAAGGADVLFFIDAVMGTDVYARALGELEAEAGLRVVRTSEHIQFAEWLESGDWDLVVSATQTGSASDENPSDKPLADWICGGGKAIVSDYRLDSAGAAEVFACSQTSFHGSTNYPGLTSTRELFEGTLALQNPGWGFYAVGLETTGAVFATGPVEEVRIETSPVNELGYPVGHAGLLRVGARDLLQPDEGLYHPNWGLEVAWDEPGGVLRHTLRPGAGLDVSGTPVLTFRVLALHSDPLNVESHQDFHVRLRDAFGRSATVPLSQARQGALRPAVAVGAGTPEKSVYESYRLPLSLFLHAEPRLDIHRVTSLDFVFERTPSGALVFDDLGFAQEGGCDETPSL